MELQTLKRPNWPLDAQRSHLTEQRPMLLTVDLHYISPKLTVLKYNVKHIP